MADELPSTVAADLARDIRGIAERARSEEDLRIGVEKLLEPALRQLGIAAQPRYERRIHRTILTAPGRADALYGQAIIEYELPGKLSTQKGLSSTRKQLERYLLGLAGSGDQREETLRRLAGIGLDGRSIFFLRYRGDKPMIEKASPKAMSTQLSLIVEEAPKGTFSFVGPYTVNEESINEFLLHLRALQRRRLVAEELADEFGPTGHLAHEMVSNLYRRLGDALKSEGDTFLHIKTFYEEWERIFGIVYGQDLVKAEKDARALAERYQITEFTDLKPLLFAVHTYYALFMKLLAAELLSLQQGALMASIVEQLPALAGESLRSRLEELENGTYFETQGIRNFLEADFFGWYLWAWDTDIENAVRKLARALTQYEPATGTLAPEATRDLLRKLYQYLVPKELRHDLGEFYTPDWLAELVLNEVGYSGDPSHRLLDPACGSGTFLVSAIRRALDFAHDSLTWRARGEQELVAQILENIVGFDLNPLAVIAARTNYLLALGSSARHLAGKDLPVYLCDSILTPQAHQAEKRPIEHQKDIPVPSAQKEFWIPEELVEKGQVSALCHLLEKCVSGKYHRDDFLALSQRELRWQDPLTEQSLAELFEKIQQLEAEGRNGLWARIIKNAFAPVFRSAISYDYVVGNPPWVNWESLADDYRNATKPIWESYGLILKAKGAAMGRAKRDIAMLFVAVGSRRYLGENGKLGFLLPFTVFKTQAGNGFRISVARNSRVEKIHDLVELHPFEGATNRTSLMIASRGQTDFPIPSVIWSNPRRLGIDQETELAEVYERTRQFDTISSPVKAGKPETPWMMTTAKAYSAAKKIVGESPWYRAHAGIYTGLNAVYWVDILSRTPAGLLIKSTSVSGLKKKVKESEAVVSQELVYPLARGRDVKRWLVRGTENHMIVPTDAEGITLPHSVLRVQYPQIYEYFFEFLRDLVNRGGEPYKSKLEPYRIKDLSEAESEAPPFYWLFNAKPSLARYKVIWKRIAGGITGKAVNFASAVIGPAQGPFLDSTKPVVLNDSLIMIPLDDEDEAHYICGILNSSIVRSVIASYTYELRMETHITQFVRVPKFNRKDGNHEKLAGLSRMAHQLVTQERADELREVERNIDILTAELYGLEDVEYQDCVKALGILAGQLEEIEEGEEELSPDSAYNSA